MSQNLEIVLNKYIIRFIFLECHRTFCYPDLTEPGQDEVVGVKLTRLEEKFKLVDWVLIDEYIHYTQICPRVSQRRG